MQNAARSRRKPTRFPPQVFEGVWSASPTPLDEKGRVDKASVARLAEHHLRLGVKGLFVAGTCGEGPWLPDGERKILIEKSVAASRGRLPIAAQVSDNSPARVADNVQTAKAAGADFAVLAPPRFLMNATPRNILNFYQAAIRASTLPVILYDLGRHAALFVPETVLSKIYAEPNIVAVKDSSSDPLRRDIALRARKRRPGLRLLTGNEFACDEYLLAGYDGVMLGGAAFHGALSKQLFDAAKAENAQLAQRLQARMNHIMWAVYGGRKLTCWLAGEKHLLVELGVFSTAHNFLGYRVTTSCRRAIAGVLARERDVLLPK